MILRPFLNNNVLVLILLVPVIVGFHILNAYFPYHTFIEKVDLGLWGRLEIFTNPISPALAGLFIALNAFQLNFLFNKHEFLEKNNYAPALFYVILMSFSHSFYQLDAVLIAHFFMLQALRLLFRLRANEVNPRYGFDGAFFIGLAATFLPPFSGLIIIFWFAAWALQPYTLRQWIIMLVGFLIPIANGLTYWWFSGHLISLNILKHATKFDYQDIVYYATAAALVILFLLSIIGIRIRSRISSIRFKKLNRSLLWFLVGTIFLGVAEMIFYQQAEWISLMFIPLSFFFTFAFIHKIWQKVASIFFYLTFIIAVFKFFLATLLTVKT